MSPFVLIAYDKPGALQTRMALRPIHLEHLEVLDRAGQLHHAGPLLDDKGAPFGSVVVFSAENLAAAQAIAAADPFVVNGVFERYTVHPTLRAFPKQT